MFRPGVLAALQAADPGGGASLTLGTWGVFLLGLLTAGAAAGWILFALSRRRAFEPGPPPALQPSLPPVAPAPVPTAPEDPVEAAFRAAETGLADAVLLCRGGRIVRAAAGSTRLLGPEPGALVGLGITRLAAAEDVLPLAEAVRRMERDGLGSLRVTFRISPPGGAAQEAAARLIRPAGAEPGSFVAVLTDVTGHAAVARGAAEMALRIDAALSVLREGVLVTGSAMGAETVLLANPGLEPILHLGPAALVGRPLAEIRARLGALFAPGELDVILAPEGSPSARLLETLEEPPRLIEIARSPLGGAGEGHLFAFRDLTRERAREEDLRRAAAEAEGARETLEQWHQQILLANEGLERRMAEFTRLNRELKALDEMKSNLLANVSHELQTPLVSIKGYTEMILKGRLGPLTDEQEKGLKVALRNVDRLIALLDSLLTFARAEKDKPPLRVEAFSLRGLVEEVLDLLRERAAARSVSMEARFPGGDLTVRGDRDRIAQVLINLLTNAVKYNRDGGRVVVEAARGSRASARVEVRDTGIGIAREDLDRIFDRFYRSGESAEEGSGLGLAITKDILRLHGCMIRADSEEGKGSVFSFTLPLEARGRGGAPPRPEGGAKEEA